MQSYFELLWFVSCRDLSANPARLEVFFLCFSLTFVAISSTHRSTHAYNYYLCTHRCAPTMIYRERGTRTIERSTDWRNSRRRARGKDPAGCKDERSCVTSVPVIKTSSQYRSARINAEWRSVDRLNWLYHRAVVPVHGIPLLLCALTHRHLNTSRFLCMQACKNISSSFRRENIHD